MEIPTREENLTEDETDRGAKNKGATETEIRLEQL